MYKEKESNLWQHAYWSNKNGNNKNSTKYFFRNKNCKTNICEEEQKKKKNIESVKIGLIFVCRRNQILLTIQSVYFQFLRHKDKRQQKQKFFAIEDNIFNNLIILDTIPRKKSSQSKTKKVQFQEPFRSKDLSDANAEFQIFQEYNSEHLLQFKSPRPAQEYSEFGRPMTKVQSLVDEDIDLDDNGESIATKREMFQRFQQFDVFLIKNRDKIERNRYNYNNNTYNASLIYDQKSNRALLANQAELPAFSGLKDIRIDFNRVQGNLTNEQLQEILREQNNDNTNTDLNSNINSGRQILFGGNPSTDSFNQNGENFSFFQKKGGRRQNKAMTLAQTQNITGIQTNIGAFTQDINNLLPKTSNVQDIILRLSIRSSLMIWKFIKLMKRKVKLHVFQELTQNQLMLINDLSHFYSTESQKNKSRVVKALSNIIKHKILYFFQFIWKYIKLQLYNCGSCIWESRPIDPTSNWTFLWLIIQFIFIIVALFYTPLELINGDAYDKKYGRPWILYKVINMMIFIFDVILKFNTGLFEKGNIVMNRKEIVRSYFKGHFLFDILAIIPIFLTLLQIDYLRPMNLLILLKVQTARRILSQIQEMISQKNHKVQHALSLLQLLLMICSVCHIFACLFMGIAVLEEKYSLTSTNWMQVQGISGDTVHWFVKYNSSLYFAVTTMITVGYGDIAPHTTYEIFFVTIAMFVSCGVFAYSFNQIGDLVREQNRLSTEFKNEMVLVNRLLEKKKINRDLKLQVRKFLEYRFYAEPQLSMEEERMVMSKLSHHLREKVILESNLQIINQCTLLTNNFSKRFLENLALRMNEIRVSKNEIIFEQNEIDDDPSLYIIDKGNIEIFVETDKYDQDITILQVLNQGTYFGEMNFFKEGMRSACARAQDFTILYGIPKSQFLETIQDFPLDFEQYCFMKDSITFDNKIKVIDMKCFVCGNEDHLSRNCNLIHFVPDKEKIILSNNFSTKQKRKHEQRKNFKQNSLKLLREANQIQNSYINKDINQNYLAINYNFLNDDPSLTEENAPDLTHNMSNIGGVPANHNLNNMNGYILNPNQNNFNINNNNNNNINIANFGRVGNEKVTILPDIKRHVSNVFTSGSVLEQVNANISRNDMSDLESPKNNYQQQTHNNLTTQNTQSNFYNPPPAHQRKMQAGRFGQMSAFQMNNLGYNNNYPKKKPYSRKVGNYGQDDDDLQNTSFVNGQQNHQSPNNFGLVQQLMAVLQKAMNNNNNQLNNTLNYGNPISTNNINSFTNLPNFGGGGLVHPGVKKVGTQVHGKIFTNESEDINGIFSGSRNRVTTRYLSYLNKKREKEYLLQQMNNQFLSDGMGNVDLSAYFERSRIYAVYYPQYNVNVILKGIENVSLKQQKQPEYFGVYSFTIRPKPKKKQSTREEINILSPTGTLNMKKSFAIVDNQNVSNMQTSTLVFNNHKLLSNFNQSFGIRHKNSYQNSPVKTLIKDNDSFKQKKNSLKQFNSLNHLKNSNTLRADSLVFAQGGGGVGSNTGFGSHAPVDKMPTKSNFGQLNVAVDCASIYQEKEKSYYPKFIFKKLFTLH